MRTVVIVLGLQVLSSTAVAADTRAFVLSGGGTPATNHDSQYLQTLTLTTGLRHRLGAAAVDVRFGAGNSEAQPKLLPDVHKVDQTGGVDMDVMEYGVIPANAAATKANVYEFFETLPPPAKPFFLFVSDHGSPNPARRDYLDNCIDLWAYDPTTYQQLSDRGCLSKDELKTLLEEHVLPTAKRVVFAMSQCFSGGFHQMSVETVDGYPTADPRICGFTAVTEDATASGCTPNVDGPNYKGYERYLTEQVTGVDVVTGRRLHGAKSNVRAAHIAAALEDTTKDIPLATSDAYLRAWADAILADGFVPRTGAGGDVRQRFTTLLAAPLSTQHFDVGVPWLNDDIHERQAFLASTMQVIAAAEPDLAQLIRTGGDAELNAKVAAIDAEMKTLDEQTQPLDAQWRSLRYGTVDPKWLAAVQAGQGTALSPDEAAWERDIFSPAEQTLGGASDGREGVANVLLRHLSGITAETPDKADAFAKYLGARDQRIGAWVAAQADQDTKATWAKVQSIGTQLAALTAKRVDLPEARDHLRRVMIYRRVIAAAVSLAEMRDATALTELQGLRACERTAL